MKNRQTLFTLARLFITVALLIALFWRVSVRDVVAEIGRADPRFLLLAIGAYLAAVVANMFKWGLLLRAQGVRAPWSALLRYTFVGLFFNNLLPAAVGGDLMRGYGLARYTGRGADAAVSIVVDRLIGLIALSGTVIVTILFARLREAAGGTDLAGAFWAALIATLGLAGGLTLMVSRRVRAWVGQLLERLAARLPLLRPFLPFLRRLARSFGAYRHQPGVLLLSLGIALVTWLFGNLLNYLLSLSLLQGTPAQEPIALLHIFIFNPLIGLSQLIPLSIGGLGLNQNLYYGFYTRLLGYPKDHVVAVSFLLQFVIYLASLPGGLIWWFDRGQAAATEAAATEA